MHRVQILLIHHNLLQEDYSPTHYLGLFCWKHQEWGWIGVYYSSNLVSKALANNITSKENKIYIYIYIYIWRKLHLPVYQPQLEGLQPQVY